MKSLRPRFIKIPRSKRAKAITAVLIILIFIFGFIIVKQAFGVTRTWDGGCGGDTSWSCDANWSSDTEPGSSDLAQFDTFDGDATIDATFAGSVRGVQITANYDGTITQNRSLTVGDQNFSQAGGEWDGTNQTFDLNEDFTVSGGQHTATTGTWTVENNFTYSGGTLAMTGATVTFDGSSIGSGANSTFTCSGSVGGTINVAKTGNGGNFTLASGCTVAFPEDVSTIGGITINGTVNQTSGSTPTLVVTRVSQNGNLSIGSNGTYNFSGAAITIYNNFTMSSGAIFDATGVTLTFIGDSSGAGADSTFTCSGVFNGTVDIAKTSNGGNFTLASGCTITFVEDVSTNGGITINGTVNHTSGATPSLAVIRVSQPANLTINSGGVYNYSGSAITVQNNLTLASGSTFDATGVTVTFSGSSIGASVDSTMSCSGTFSGVVNVAKSSNGGNFTLASGCTIAFQAAISTGGSITINGTVNHTSGSPTLNLFRTFHNGSLSINSGGKYVYGGTNITLDNDFTLATGAIFDLSGITLTLDGTTSGDDANLTCGDVIKGNIVINKSDSGGTTNFVNDCIVEGNFTRTDGVISNPGSARTLTIKGNFSMSTSDAFGGSNLTLIMGGGSNQSITQNAGTMSGLFSVNKTTGTASLSTNFTTGSTCNIVEGAFDINGRTFTCGSTFTVEDGGIWELFANETSTSPTLNTGSTVKYTGDGGSDVDNYTLKDLSYHHLTISSTDSGDTYTPPDATEDILGNFTLNGGTFTAPSSAMTVGGNFSNLSGTFSHNNSTVVFNDNSKSGVIAGNTTFYNFTSTTPRKTFIFKGGSTTTISNALTLTGINGQYIRLAGETPPAQWDIISNGTENVSYVQVRDSDACGGDTIVPTFSVSNGNNNCWTFASAPGSGDVRIEGGAQFNEGTVIRGL